MERTTVLVMRSRSLWLRLSVPRPISITCGVNPEMDHGEDGRGWSPDRRLRLGIRRGFVERHAAETISVRLLSRRGAARQPFGAYHADPEGAPRLYQRHLRCRRSILRAGRGPNGHMRFNVACGGPHDDKARSNCLTPVRYRQCGPSGDPASNGRSGARVRGAPAYAGRFELTAGAQPAGSRDGPLKHGAMLIQQYQSVAPVKHYDTFGGKPV